MRAVVKTGPWKGASFVEDHPEPAVGDNDVLIEVGAVSVCGTDREMFEWSQAAQAFAPDLPVVLGHEFAGTVIGVGSRVSSISPGDRVACETHVPCGHCFLCRSGNAHNCMNMKLLAMHLDGAFAERISVPELICFPLPGRLAMEVGALLEPAGVAWHAIQRTLKGVAGNTVLISGGGPVGLFITQFARLLGAVAVIVIEPNRFRREMARTLGARVFAPGEDITTSVRSMFPERGGVDVAFEASGSPTGLTALLEAVRPEGEVVTVGHPSRPIEVDIARYINKKGLTLRGVFGRRIWDTWQGLAQLLASGKVDLSWTITHRLPLGELGPIVELLSHDANKVVVFPQQ